MDQLLLYERLIHPNIVPKLVLSSSNKDPEENSEYWLEDGQNEVKSQLLKNINKKVAKNVIMFIGDGMGMSTITASRILSGQRKGQRGEESNLAMDKFPTTGLSKVSTLLKYHQSERKFTNRSLILDVLHRQTNS